MAAKGPQRSESELGELARDCLATERELGEDLRALVGEMLAARPDNAMPMARFLGFLAALDLAVKTLRMNGGNPPVCTIILDLLRSKLGDRI